MVEVVVLAAEDVDVDVEITVVDVVVVEVVELVAVVAPVQGALHKWKVSLQNDLPQMQ